jgi:hypothetical protein
MLIDIGATPDNAATCEELTQHTFDEGALYFDVYFYPAYMNYWGGDLGVQTLTARFNWPAEWGFLSGELAAAGTLTQVEPNEYTASIDWSPDCPILPETNSVLRVARFRLQVTGYGSFEAAAYSGDFCAPEPHHWENEYGYWGDAQAGVICAWCDTRCNLGLPSLVLSDLDSLSLTAHLGETTQAEIHATMDCWSYPCEMTAWSSEPWMNLNVIPMGQFERLIQVYASTDGLAVGTYHGTISTQIDCVRCIPVTFTVEEPVPTQETSWGKLKAQFRDDSGR